MKLDESDCAGIRRTYSSDSPARAAETVGLTGLLPEKENETLRNVERSISYMREHLNKPLQVATLAAFANVSPSHFFALFKQLTGCPPMDYFTRLRMHHACRLLDSTSASVKEVAAALGYDDQFYFSRVFKAVNHMPPSRYRASQPSCASTMGHRSWSVSPSATNPARMQA